MLLGALMLGVAVFTCLAPEPEHVAVATKTLKEAVVEPLIDFFERPGAWAFLWLIVLYKLGDAFAGALSTTFLLRGAGFTMSQVRSEERRVGKEGRGRWGRDQERRRHDGLGR